MSAQKRRGLPKDDASAGRTRAVRRTKGRGGGFIRRTLRGFVRLAGIAVFLTAGWAVLFVGTRCYSGTPETGTLTIPAGAESLPEYGRGEALTYLTLPEWFIVYSADEYAAFVGRQPPSAFPYIGSARQYWRYYSAACAATKGVYPFETGYHMMLGIIGTSFTVESGAKAIYENTIGRATEWLSSTDTPEDAFARRTAQEYGTFMHTVPWYEFPFGSKLLSLWKETPLTGPHMLRKVERRIALSAEYGVKAIYGALIGAASGAAYDPEEQRIYARLERAPASVFADQRVRQVKAAGPDAMIVTLPRYEAFTTTMMALTGKGVRVLDVAGNDEILITVLARRGVPTDVPHSRLIASEPVLSDPTMQRMALSVPVSSLREIAAHLATHRAVIEHIYDY